MYGLDQKVNNSNFGLIDCDNFFVSCERIFKPSLKNKPVVVLSNNDGCVVARSPEAKAIGIPMCAPFFKVEKILRSQNGIALSSNYELYADISKRVMSLINQNFANSEIYSIDEAFVHLDSSCLYEEVATSVRNQILKEIGISVSIGIAKTKTLCKIAGDHAKKHSKIYHLHAPEDISQKLKSLDVIDVWGVGRNTVKKLNFMGIFTGEDLRTAPTKQIRNSFGINLEKTVLELNQHPCLEIAHEDTQQSILSSRTFETEVKDIKMLEQIISEFVDSACFRMRKQNSVAQGIIVFVSSNRFNPNHKQYQNSRLVSLDAPTGNTSKFITAMQKGLRQIFEPGILYKRAGVTLVNIQPQSNPQGDLLSDTKMSEKEQKLMTAFDKLNTTLGKKTVFFGTQAPNVQHYIKREFKTSRYTTCWDELAEVN